MTEPKCSTHPDAPHGFNRNGSHNAGRYVCDCEGWNPPDSKGVTKAVYTPVKPTKDSQTIEVLKLVISAVDRAAKTARLNAEKHGDSFVSQEFDCIAQDLEYFLSEMKLAGISVYTAGTKTKAKQYLNERYI